MSTVPSAKKASETTMKAVPRVRKKWCPWMKAEESWLPGDTEPLQVDRHESREANTDLDISESPEEWSNCGNVRNAGIQDGLEGPVLIGRAERVAGGSRQIFHHGECQSLGGFELSSSVSHSAHLPPTFSLLSLSLPLIFCLPFIIILLLPPAFPPPLFKFSCTGS